MVAKVIPYRRTVRGVEWFEYAVADDLEPELEPGSLVRIDFRGKPLLGLVLDVVDDPSTDAELKPVLEVLPHDWWKTPGRIAWLQWFAEYYYVSLAHAFYTLQFPIVQRPRKENVVPESDSRTDLAAISTEQELIRDRVLENSPALLWYSHREDCLAVYRGIALKTTGHTLLLVPDSWSAATVAEQLDPERTRLVLDHRSGSQWHHLLRELGEDGNLIVIATRQGVLLPLQLFEQVIVDQEEARSHKQYGLNPRFHVREVVREGIHRLSGASGAPRLLLTSLAPSVRTFEMTRLEEWKVVDMRRKHDREIRIVDMEQERTGGNYTWFSYGLREEMAKSKHALLFLNRVGSFRTAHCRDCQSLLPVDSRECSSCHSVKLYKSGRGTAQLEQDLRDLLAAAKSDKTVLRVDRDQDVDAVDPSQVRAADIVVATEKIFGILPISHFDLIAVLSIDHLLVVPHFQAAERTAQLFTRLASTDALVLLQSSAVSHPVIRAVSQDRYDLVLEEELAIRQEFSLPPYGVVASAIDTRTGTQKRLPGLPDRETLPKHIVIDRADA